MFSSEVNLALQDTECPHFALSELCGCFEAFCLVSLTIMLLKLQDSKDVHEVSL